MSSINSYLSFIGSIPPLSREEETELIIKAQSGYGFDKPLSLSEIGNIVGLTKGGVHEAEKKIRKLAISNKNNENLADYLVA